MKDDDKKSFIIRKTSRLKALFKDVAGDPGVGFAAGNTVLAASVAGPGGIAISGAALCTTTALKLYKHITDKPVFNSLYVTAAANMVTAASAYYHSAYLGGQTLTGFFSAAALSLWGGAHIFLARREAHNGKHGKVFSNPFLYSLGGNLAALQVNGVQAAPTMLVLAAAARSLFKQLPPKAPADSFSAFFNKHVTPVRLTAAGFITGAFIAAANKDPAYMSAQLLWGWAAFNLDKEQNKALAKDTKKLICS